MGGGGGWMPTSWSNVADVVRPVASLYTGAYLGSLYGASTGIGIGGLSGSSAGAAVGGYVAASAGAALDTGGGGSDVPSPSAQPTEAQIAAREPDMERLRRQRMAALLAQGRSGTIMGQTQASNTIGAGPGKALIGQ